MNVAQRDPCSPKGTIGRANPQLFRARKSCDLLSETVVGNPTTICPRAHKSLVAGPRASPLDRANRPLVSLSNFRPAQEQRALWLRERPMATAVIFVTTQKDGLFRKVSKLHGITELRRCTGSDLDRVRFGR